MNISIIAAMSKNRVIGKDNDMPWHLSDDLKNFKEITTGKTIIMGRMTFQSIGKPLPNRKNIVLSKKLEDSRILVLNNIEQAINLSKNEDEIFIIGGQEIYSQTINIASKLYLTKIDEYIEGDKYFPKYDLEGWEKISSKIYKKNEKNSHNFTSEVFVKNPNN